MLRSTPILFTSFLVLCASCVSVQDFPGPTPPSGLADADADAEAGALGLETGTRAAIDAGASAESGSAPPPLPPVEGTLRWEWANPAPTGKSLFGIGGTSENDIWVAGDGGTVAHFDGTRWNIRHRGAETTRYFAVGVKGPKNVWVAGDSGGQIGVVHFDGTAWIDSYPFAGSAFGTFSHGPGARLFAVVDYSIVELTDDGTWVKTDTHVNDVFGAPADVWVASSGEAWALTGEGLPIAAEGTGGAKLLRLPAGSRTWQMIAQPAGVPTGAVGLALSGAGTQACAFYTGNASGTGFGFLRYDGQAWSVASTDPMQHVTPDGAPHGSRLACLANGAGVLTYGGELFAASATPPAPPNLQTPYDFPGERLFGAWSPDGREAYGIGTLGAFMTQTSAGNHWLEGAQTLRQDLLGADVGLDGAVMAVTARDVNRSAGGDVIQWQEGWRKTQPKGALQGPSSPAAVAVIRGDDAWVLSNDNSMVGVSHWTGSFGLTRFLGSAEALAVFAPADNDVWVSGRQRCPDFDPLPGAACSKSLRGYLWHYDGTTWTPLDAPAAYVSIHGTGPRDVWFAGDAVAHWDGSALVPVAALTEKFAGVWSSAPGRVWLWGEHSVLYDGTTSTPLQQALHASTEWVVGGIAESSAGDVFVLTTRATGTSLLWFDPTHTRLIEQLSSDLALTAIRGRGNELWAIGSGGASLRFALPDLR